MMKAILLVLLTGCSCYSFSQPYRYREEGQFKIYFGFGGGYGTNGSLWGASSSFVLRSDWGGSISFRQNSFRAKNTPADYYSGGLIGNTHPRDYFSYLSFQIIREFSTPSVFKFAVEAGPSLVTYSVAHFSPVSKPGWFSSNYAEDYEETQSLGLSLRAKAELPFCRVLGLELAAFTNLNAFLPFTGVELYLNLGRVRPRPPKVRRY